MGITHELKYSSFFQYLRHDKYDNSKSPQVSCSFLNILDNPSSAVISIGSSLSLVSNSFSLFKALLTVLNTPNSTAIMITFMFHSFYSFREIFKHLSPFSIFFHFPYVIHCNSNKWINNTLDYKFFVFRGLTLSGFLADIRWFGISKSNIIVSIFYSWVIGVCTVWLNFYFLHIYLWLTLNTQALQARFYFRFFFWIHWLCY